MPKFFHLAFWRNCQNGSWYIEFFRTRLQPASHTIFRQAPNAYVRFFILFLKKNLGYTLISRLDLSWIQYSHICSTHILLSNNQWEICAWFFFATFSIFGSQLRQQYSHFFFMHNRYKLCFIFSVQNDKHTCCYRLFNLWI